METLALIDLAGFVALLLWGLHMVQTGILRAYGGYVRNFLRDHLRHPLTAFGAGLAATTVLQSSTATGLIVTGLCARGLVELTPALAVVLGGNVGTALIAQALAFNVAVITPVLVLAGVITFRKASNSRSKDLGRAVIGLGLILFALQAMTGLLHNAAHSETLKTLLGLIDHDAVLMLVLGAALAWLMYSSVAVVLLIMSLAAQGLIPLEMAFAMVIGANLGSAFNPLLNVFDRSNPATLRLPVGNLINRLTGCVIAVPLLVFCDRLPPVVSAYPSQAVAGFHVLFNVVLSLIFLPLIPVLSMVLKHYLPERAVADPAQGQYLDKGLLDQPAFAIASAAREAMRMADVTEAMLRDTAQAFFQGDRDRLDTIKQTDDVLDALNLQIKRYLTSISPQTLSDGDRGRADDVLAFSMSLEHVGDAISQTLLKHAAKRIKRQQVLSHQDRHELESLFERVARNIRLASAVFITLDKVAAQQLVVEKQAIDALEIQATRDHFDRLRQEDAETLDMSALHLDVLRDLRLINAQLTATARRVLRAEGPLDLAMEAGAIGQ